MDRAAHALEDRDHMDEGACSEAVQGAEERVEHYGTAHHEHGTHAEHNYRTLEDQEEKYHKAKAEPGYGIAYEQGIHAEHDYKGSEDQDNQHHEVKEKLDYVIWSGTEDRADQGHLTQYEHDTHVEHDRQARADPALYNQILAHAGREKVGW